MKYFYNLLNFFKINLHFGKKKKKKNFSSLHKGRESTLTKIIQNYMRLEIFYPKLIILK